MADAQDLKRLIVALSAAYRTEIDQAQAVTWGRAIRDVDGDVLDEATDQWIQHSAKLPRPAEIIQTAQIIVRRRRTLTPALAEARPGPEQQKRINRHGMAMVREELARNRLRVGQNLDEYLDEKEAPDA